MSFLCGNFLAWPLNCILATKYPWWGKLGPMISCMAWSSECPMPQWLPPWRQKCLPLNIPLPYSCLFPCGLSLSCLFSFHYFLHDKFLPPPDALSIPRGENTPWIMREYTRLRSERTKHDDFLRVSGLSSLQTQGLSFFLKHSDETYHSEFSYMDTWCI